MWHFLFSDEIPEITEGLLITRSRSTAVDVNAPGVEMSMQGYRRSIGIWPRMAPGNMQFDMSFVHGAANGDRPRMAHGSVQFIMPSVHKAASGGWSWPMGARNSTCPPSTGLRAAIGPEWPTRACNSACPPSAPQAATGPEWPTGACNSMCLLSMAPQTAASPKWTKGAKPQQRETQRAWTIERCGLFSTPCQTEVSRENAPTKDTRTTAPTRCETSRDWRASKRKHHETLIVFMF